MSHATELAKRWLQEGCCNRPDECEGNCMPKETAALLIEQDKLLRDIDTKIGHFADAPNIDDLPLLGLVGDVARMIRSHLK